MAIAAQDQIRATVFIKRIRSRIELGQHDQKNIIILDISHRKNPSNTIYEEGLLILD